MFSMVFEFFKVWNGIPALLGVTQTLTIAGNGLMSFSLVLFCLVTLFAGSAMLAFGQKVDSFHDMTSAIIQTLVIMTTGDPAVYNRLLELNPAIASIWYWLLVCVMYLVCLNLVLCILVDAYGESNTMVLNQEEHTVTLLEQGSDTAKHLFYSAAGVFGVKDSRCETVENSHEEDVDVVHTNRENNQGKFLKVSPLSSSRNVAWAPS
jgi:hypothetical protein